MTIWVQPTRLISVPISSLRDALSNSELRSIKGLERLRREARLVLALDKRSVQLAEYDAVVDAIITDHLQYILECCINIVAYFTWRFTYIKVNTSNTLGAIPPLSREVYMAWFLIKHCKDFTFLYQTVWLLQFPQSSNLMCFPSSLSALLKILSRPLCFTRILLASFCSRSLFILVQYSDSSLPEKIAIIIKWVISHEMEDLSCVVTTLTLWCLVTGVLEESRHSGWTRVPVLMTLAAWHLWNATGWKWQSLTYWERDASWK